MPMWCSRLLCRRVSLPLSAGDRDDARGWPMAAAPTEPGTASCGASGPATSTWAIYISAGWRGQPVRLPAGSLRGAPLEGHDAVFPAGPQVGTLPDQLRLYGG